MVYCAQHHLIIVLYLRTLVSTLLVESSQFRGAASTLHESLAYSAVGTADSLPPQRGPWPAPGYADSMSGDLAYERKQAAGRVSGEIYMGKQG